MGFKKYAYYNKGNKVAIVERSSSSSGGNLAVAHCTLGGYTTKDTCEAAGGQWIPGSSGIGSDAFDKYLSPSESVANGLEIEYSYSPTYNIQSTGTEGTDFHRFIAWGSDGTNLLLFTYGSSAEPEAAVKDLSSIFAADDWIYISGSGRWSGLHQVKSTGGTTGILTLKTLCNLGPSKITIHGTYATDETFNGQTSESDKDIEAFKDAQSNRDTAYVFVDLAEDAANNGIFSLSSKLYI